MPLKSGSSNDAIGENIARLMDEGKSQDQAVAIALSQSGRSNKSARFRRAFNAWLGKDFSIGDGLQDYNLGPGQKKKTRKKGQTAKTVFEQFPRDYVVRDKTGIADALKYTADQVRDKGKFIPGSADVRHRNGSYRRGVLPGMHYHGNQPHVHQGGDVSHGHKPGAV